jgi:hypothetical protein
MQPLPGDGTNAIVNQAIWIAGTGAFIAGMNWWWRWAETNNLVWIRRSFLHNLALLLALELLMVVIHEFGHAAAGAAFGMKLRAFVVGPFQWRVREGKWEFRFILSGFLAIGGATAVAPTDPNRPLWRDICMVAAGPVGYSHRARTFLGTGLAAARLLHHALSADRGRQPDPIPDEGLLFRWSKDLPASVARSVGRSPQGIFRCRCHHHHTASSTGLRHRRD